MSLCNCFLLLINRNKDLKSTNKYKILRANNQLERLGLKLFKGAVWYRAG